jgi:hypothetical protein
LEPASHQDHDYDFDFVQKLIHEANRKKEEIASNLKSRITQSIHNDIQFYELLRDLQGVFYKNHNEILQTVIVESEPSWRAVPESASFGAPMVKTAAVRCVGSWLECAS